MNKLEQMHLDTMIVKDLQSASKSAEITQQIAIEFAKFCLNKAKDLDTYTVYHNIDNVFQEFLKTKQ